MPDADAPLMTPRPASYCELGYIFSIFDSELCISPTAGEVWCGGGAQAGVLTAGC